MADDGFTVQFDTSGFNRAMSRLREAVPNEMAPELLNYQGAAFVRTMMKSPPVYNKAAKRITRTMTQAVTPLTQQKVWSLLGGNPRLAKRLRQLGISPGSTAPLSRAALDAIIGTSGLGRGKNFFRGGGILQNIGRYRDWTAVNGGQLEAHIKSKQDQWGRVERRQPFYTTAIPEYKSLLRKELKARGLLKAGWATAAQFLGVKMPAYIANQTRWGSYENQARSSVPLILMTNDAVKLPDYEIFVDRALEIRQLAMERQLLAIFRGKAVNLGFTTIAGESWGGNWQELDNNEVDVESGGEGDDGGAFELLT